MNNLANHSGTIANVFTAHKNELFSAMTTRNVNTLRTCAINLLTDPSLQKNPAVNQARTNFMSCRNYHHLESTVITYMTGLKG